MAVFGSENVLDSTTGLYWIYLSEMCRLKENVMYL